MQPWPATCPHWAHTTAAVSGRIYLPCTRVTVWTRLECCSWRWQYLVSVNVNKSGQQESFVMRARTKDVFTSLLRCVLIMLMKKTQLFLVFNEHCSWYCIYALRNHYSHSIYSSMFFCFVCKSCAFGHTYKPLYKIKK